MFSGRDLIPCVVVFLYLFENGFSLIGSTCLREDGVLVVAECLTALLL